MDIELLDDDGYPTDEALNAIRTFEGTPEQLVEFARELWQWDHLIHVRRPWRDRIEVDFVTGGWSGNEDVIAALDGSVFWFLYWSASYRGGKHVFSVPVDQWSESKFLGALTGKQGDQR